MGIIFVWVAAIVLGLCNFVYAADFSFVQVSDTHWGYNKPEINPDYAGTLKKVIQAINELQPQPDFVVMTGDLTHTTDDPAERKKRLVEFRDIVKDLKAPDVRFLPGEHDAALDNGAAFQEVFGKTHYTFEHKGVHFIALDNVSDPTSSIGDAQLQWLSDDLSKLDQNAPIIVFTHRPLFDLYPAWDWATRDGAKAMELLKPYKKVHVFYGHIHQFNRYVSGNVTNFAAKGTMYPLPAPGSVPKKAPVPWDPAKPYGGLGFRSVMVKTDTGEVVVTEHPVIATTIAKAIQYQPQDPPELVIKITAKKFEYSPGQITIRKGEPVALEFTSLDVLHGFNCPGLGVRTDIPPGKVSTVRIFAKKAGTYEFFCDNFCGEGHENMRGKIIVTE